jgi:hypothetical protein
VPVQNLVDLIAPIHRRARRATHHPDTSPAWPGFDLDTRGTGPHHPKTTTAIAGMFRWGFPPAGIGYLENDLARAVAVARRRDQLGVDSQRPILALAGVQVGVLHAVASGLVEGKDQLVDAVARPANLGQPEPEASA